MLKLASNWSLHAAFFMRK